VSSQFNDSRTAIQPEKDIRPDPSSANTAVHVSLSSRYLQFSKNTAKTQKLAVRQIPPREPSTKASRDTLVKSRQPTPKAQNRAANVQALGETQTLNPQLNQPEIKSPQRQRRRR
jgi:hypothetical protein